MKKLFLFLLKKYTKTETGRLLVQEILHEQVCNDYTEQTTFGNVYNSYIEFAMGNPFIKELVRQGDTESLKMIKSGIDSAHVSAIDYIQYKKAWHNGKVKEITFEEIFNDKKKEAIKEFILEHKKQMKPIPPSSRFLREGDEPVKPN